MHRTKAIKDNSEFIKNSLESGHALSLEVLKSIAFNQGRTHVYFPDGVEVSEEELNEHLEKNFGFTPPRKGETEQEIPQILDALAQEIESFLSLNPSGVVIFENALASSTDPFLKNYKASPIFFCEGRVFYFVTKMCLATTDLVEMLRSMQSVLDYRGFMITSKDLTDVLNRSNSIEVSRTTIREHVSSISGIVLGAFDGEGFVIWTPRPS